MVWYGQYGWWIWIPTFVPHKASAVELLLFFVYKYPYERIFVLFFLSLYMHLWEVGKREDEVEVYITTYILALGRCWLEIGVLGVCRMVK
jgi:hypothetical protein